jgi:acyl-CoA thioester hydrolase
MPRLRLKPLDVYSFTTEIEVRYTDLNYGGHLGNDRLLALIQEARAAFLGQYGFSELDCDGVALTMADSVILYQGEAFAGDLLRFEVAVGETTHSGFRLFYRVTRPADSRAIALAETGMVCFDYAAKKIKALPDAAKSAFAGEQIPPENE